LFATVLDAEGGLDILVANSARAETEMLGKITEENFDATFNVNARATLFTVQKALPLIRTGGSVILIGSNLRLSRRSRLQCLQRNQGRPAVLYPHLDPGVQRPRHPVQHVEPGPIDTAMLDAQADKAQFAAAVPLNRLGRPEEIAAAALFLASTTAAS